MKYHNQSHCITLSSKFPLKAFLQRLCFHTASWNYSKSEHENMWMGIWNKLHKMQKLIYYLTYSFTKQSLETQASLFHTVLHNVSKHVQQNYTSHFTPNVLLTIPSFKRMSDGSHFLSTDVWKEMFTSALF